MKNSWIYFNLFSFVFIMAAAPSWSMMVEDYPLTAIVKRGTSPDGPRVAFDLDYTLCIQPYVSGQDSATVDEKYPDAQLIRFWHDANGDSNSDDVDEDTYFFYPHYGEAFLTLLDWGWHVDFFSSTGKERNEVVIPAYLKVALEPYSQDIETDYAALTQRGELRIFSHHHLSYEKNRALAKYEVQGDYKKDLSIFGSISDTVLAEDDRSYVKGKNQYPFIGLSWRDALKFGSAFLRPENGNLHDSENPLNNAVYILGILAECKGLLDERKALSLRASLDQALRNPRYVNSIYNSRDETPWFLYPTKENPKLESWIGQGKALINQMRARAKPIEAGKSKSNYHEFEVNESMFINTIDLTLFW